MLQVLEGYWYYFLGDVNCGTQLKLSALLTGIVFALIGYKFLMSDANINNKWLYLIGNCSFGIYFSHLAVMKALNQIPYYTQIIRYPFNAMLAVGVSLGCVVIGRKILGKYSGYLGL